MGVNRGENRGGRGGRYIDDAAALNSRVPCAKRACRIRHNGASASNVNRGAAARRARVSMRDSISAALRVPPSPALTYAAAALPPRCMHSRVGAANATTYGANIAGEIKSVRHHRRGARIVKYQALASTAAIARWRIARAATCASRRGAAREEQRESNNAVLRCVVNAAAKNINPRHAALVAPSSASRTHAYRAHIAADA